MTDNRKDMITVTEQMSIPEAQLMLAELNAEVLRKDYSDNWLSVWSNKQGLPLEITTRLQDLWSVTKNMAGQVIHIGKIIVCKIIDFIKVHPHAAIGAALGAAVGSLTALIPWIGPLIAPLATAICSMLGLLSGTLLDHCNESGTLMQALIMAAKDFFKLLADIFMALKEQLA